MKANEFLTRDGVTLVLPLSNVVRVHYGDKNMLARCVKDAYSGHTFVACDQIHFFGFTFQELMRKLGADSLLVEDCGFGAELLAPEDLSNIFISVSWEQEREVWEVQQFYKSAQQ